MKVIAHRFFAGLYPENSLRGIEACAAMNVAAIETDIRLTADGVPVLLHDRSLTRTSNLTGPVTAWRFESLRSESRLPDGAPVPSLAECLDRFRATSTQLYLELETRDTVAPVLDLVKDFGLADRVVISSFQHDAVLDAKTAAPGLRTMALLEGCPVDLPGIVAACRADEAGLGLDTLCRRGVEALNAAGVEVHAWTVRTEEDLGYAQEFPLAGIFADYHPAVNE